jgi:hypothetical protein
MTRLVEEVLVGLVVELLLRGIYWVIGWLSFLMT